MKEYIKKYINQGFKIFPCNADKSPCTPQGFKNAHDNFDILCKQFYRDDMLIGLPTGNINGLVVIDIDIKEGRTVDELKEEIRQYGELPETFEVETMSGGRHLYYAVTETNISSHTHFFDKTLPVDIRGNGGYVVAGDYNKYFPLDVEDIDDIKSLMSPLPEWIEQYRKQLIESPTDIEGELLPESEVREIRSALAYLDADDRDTWVRVGMCLKSTKTAQAKGLWTEWSMKSVKFDPVDQEKKWKTFKPTDISIASIFGLAKSYGWTTTYEKTVNVLSPEECKNIVQEKKFERPRFPKDLLNPPGLVGEICEYMNSQAQREQPILSLASALTFCGALMGRKFQLIDGIRTNIYCMGLGDTGCGKENTRKTIKKIIYETNIENMRSICSVERIASETSIYTALSEEPSPMFMIDEIGIFLKTTQNYQAPHLAGIQQALLNLFTSSDVDTVGKSYADAKKQVRLNHPNLCIYGTATQDQFYSSLTKENVEHGLLGRMLVFESEDDRPQKKRYINYRKPSKDMVDKVKHIYNSPKNANPKGNISGDTIVDPPIVHMTDEAEEMFWKFENDNDDYIRRLKESGRIHRLHVRSVEIAKKIALIIAVGDSVYDEQKIVKPQHVDYAIKLTCHLFESFLYSVEGSISENIYEKEKNKILTIIRTKGKISQSELTRKSQHLNNKLRKEILADLMESEQIAETYEEEKGKQKKKLVAI